MKGQMVVYAPTRHATSSGKGRSTIGVFQAKFWKSHLRRMAIELIDLFFNHDWIFWIVGLINKKLKLIKTVFLVYPANDKYALSYAYPGRLRKNRWDPWPVGLFFQNGKVGVTFAISANDSWFRDEKNKAQLVGLVARTEKLQTLFHAEQKTFAGILPGVLFAQRLVRKTPEADLTTAVVAQAVREVKSLEGLGSATPTIVLGGGGFIGRRLIKSLSSESTISVDIGQDKTWPDHLRPKPVVLVNASAYAVLEKYENSLWPGTVIVNEVYPEPSPELAERLRKIGCRCYHVVGVKAKALPSFPGGYEGGVPCCAAWLSERMEVIIKKIA